MQYHLDIVISNSQWPAKFTDAGWLNKVFAQLLGRFNWPEALTELELGIEFATDQKIAALNEEFRSKNVATNVLSFPAQELKLGDCDNIEVSGNYAHLGDMVLAYDYICKEATSKNLSLEHHLIHLIIHASLHLLGFDHEVIEEAEVMEGLEIEILAEFGIENPYL